MRLVVLIIFTVAVLSTAVAGIFLYQKIPAGAYIIDPVIEQALEVGMYIRSPQFLYGENIPSKFTCDGQDINPELLIGDIPSQAQSLAIIMEDPDSVPRIWDHWVMFNIPASGSVKIEEGIAPKGVSGVNSWGRLGYGGPCPGKGEHSYIFNVYALDTMLNLPQGSQKSEIQKAMQGHILEESKVVGLYARAN